MNEDIFALPDTCIICIVQFWH